MKKNKKKGILREIIEFALQITIALAIAISLNSGAFALTLVVGPSMENTLHDSEKLFVDRLSYRFSEPEHEDIIIFLKGETIDGLKGNILNTLKDIKMRTNGKVRRNRLVKRVIGLPGDTINIEDNIVYRNNEIIEEDYVKGNTFHKQVEFPLVVPEGKVFVMGDNRENSNDSRSFGVVDLKSIEGKVVFRIWPFSEIKKLN